MWVSSQVPHFPRTKGSYVPGCMDVMLGYSKSGIFMRLYYPTKAKFEESSHSKWVPWFADDNYLVNLASTFRLPSMLIRVMQWWNSTSNIHIPTLYGEKINTDSKLKCIIMSPGYAGSRSVNSIICNELASRGYLVAVLEHRDGSASYAYFYESKENAAGDVRTVVPIKRIYFFRGHYETSNEQIHQRTDECIKLIDFLTNLNKGVIPHNVINDVPTDREISFKLEDLVGLLDTENLTVAGHSFGGATALAVLSKRKEIKQGIILDPWMFPIKEENIAEQVTQPLLFINSETYHTRSSIVRMAKYLTSEQRQMFTILHTTHESQTDSPCVLGYVLNPLTKKLDPYVALDINNALMLRFLKQQTGHDENIADCESFLSEQETNIATGLTKLWG